MKKRLLSALLAVVMVVTLLPLSVMPAFATAPSKEGETVYYFAKNAKLTGAKDTSATAKTAGWYVRTGSKSGEYVYSGPINEGIVTSVATSGSAAWYSKPGIPADGKTTPTKPGSFTVLGSNVTIDKLDWTITNAKLYDNTLTIEKYDTAKAQSITVNGTNKHPGTLALPTTGPVGKSLAVTATYATITGNISATNEAKKSVGTDKVNVQTYGSGTIKLTNCTLEAPIDLPKGTVTLDKTTGTVAITMGTCAASQTGTVTLDHGSSVSSVALYGASTLNVKDTSDAGAVTVFGGSQKDLPGNVGKAADKVTNPNWGAKINLETSGKITSINKGTQDNDRNSLEAGAVTNGDTKDTSTHTIDAKSNASIGDITLDYANVTLTGAGAGDITVPVGSVKLSSSATAGAITLGDASLKGKCTLEISGDNTTVAGEVNTSAVAASNLTVKISGGKLESKTAIALGSEYKGGGITGGTFGASVPKAAWLGNVSYEINRDGSYTYTNSFADAVSAYTDDPENNVIAIAGGTGACTIGFVLDGTDDPAFELHADANTRILLPTVIGKRSVTKWYTADNTPLTAGEYYPVSESATLTATSTEADLGTINGVSATVKADDYTVQSPNLAASIVGNTIKLSGAVDLGPNNYAPIELVFTTTTSATTEAAIKALTVNATYYNNNPKSVLFIMPDGTIGGSLEVSNDFKEVGLKGSNTKFTVDCSGLRKLEKVSEDTKVGTPVASVSASGVGTEEKNNLIAELKKSTIDFALSPAFNQAINKVLASYTESSVNSAIASGRRIFAQKEYSKTDAATLARSEVMAYDTLKIQVYLDIKVTNLVRSGGGTDGSITLDITPKYREVLYKGTSTTDFVEVSTGKSLDSALLKSTDGTCDITIKLPTADPKIFESTGLWAHHGDYVYEVNKTGTFTDLHGFSSFTISAIGPVASVDKVVRNGAVVDTTDENYKGPSFNYDTLAAAVADVADGGTVKVNAGYKGTTSIPVSGSARQFTVDNKANAGTALTFTGASVTSEGKNDSYQVELTRDNVTTARVRTNTSSDGTISVSSTSVKAGSTFTATLTPKAGYVASGVSVVCDKGTATTSGSDGVYTVTVPAGATSVTVTPTFKKATTYANITVSSASNGYGTVDQSVNVLAGTTVTVTLTPYNNYRSISVTGRADKGTVNLTRQSDNQWTFAVPADATSIVLTPVFDQNNGTMFTDVLSTGTRDFFDAVGWANSRGIIADVVTNKYIFNPYVNCTRAEMLNFLYRASNSPSVAGLSNPFRDVKTSDSFYNAAVWAYHKGISQGYGTSDTFAPNAVVDRGQALTFLYRMEGTPPVTGGNKFVDAAQSWYISAINWGAQNGITLGTNAAGTEFSPTRTCSRIEIVTFLWRDKT